MRNPTDLMKSILTDEMAQRIIDYVSPIYGNSYVALWIYQAMGVVLGEVYNLACALKSETTPATADLLLREWEAHYDIPVDVTLTKEQRQLRLITKMTSRGPCNPARLESAISSALGGVKVDITENVAKNTFLVNIREVVPDFRPAVAVLERMKPSHLIYHLRVATQMVADADLKVAIALTHAESFTVDVKPTSASGGGGLPSVDGDGTLIYENIPTLQDDGTLI